MKKLVSLLLAACMALSVTPRARAEGAASVGSALYLSAKSAVVIEAETGTVLYEKDMNTHRAMASTTKIMTAILTIEAGDLDREFTVDSYAIMVEGTSMGLREGDRVSRRDLLYGILLPSGNDAANAAAVSVSGSIPAFVDKMNEKAQALGLSDTHFATPSGLDADGHYTSAYDLARLTAYAMKNELFREIVSSRYKTLEYGNPPYSRTLYNSNKMLTRYEGAVGVKTGFTDNARRCLVSAAVRDGVMLIAVTLNDPDDWNDHEKLLNYGFSRVKSYTLDTNCTAQVSVAGSGRTVKVCADEATLALTPDQRSRLERRVLLPRIVYGSVAQGQELGSLEFYVDGKNVKSVPLTAAEDVPADEKPLSLMEKLRRFILRAAG